MVDTPRTTAQIQGDFSDGGAAGNETPQKARNAFISGPQWDVIAGTPAPAIIRGTYDGAAYLVANGGAVGAGQSSGQRTTNGTVLNALFTAAASNGKMVELPPNVYEFTSSTGLVIPPGAGFVLRGSANGTQIRQFYVGGTGAPVLVVGDPAASVSSSSIEIEGLWLAYGASQTGLTHAGTLQVNLLGQSRIGNIGIGGVGNPGYRNIWLNAGQVFSCSFYDFNCNQAQQDQFYCSTSGTGNVFSNFYLNNGGIGVYNALAGSYINYQSGVTNEMTWTQLNCEWGATNRLMDIQNMIGLHFIDLHVEGIEFTGAGPTAFFTSNSAIIWDTCDFVDLLVQTAHMSGTLCVMLDYNASSSVLQMNNFTWIANATGEITAPILLFSPSGGTLGNDTSVVTINKGFFRDATGFVNAAFIQSVQFDVHMPITSSRFFCPLRFDRYDWGPGGSRVTKGVLYPVDSTYTHYGQQDDWVLLVDVSITSFTITLAATMGATGNEPVRTGTRVHVRRETGTPSGTLLVKDDAGTTLTTNTTAAADYFYVFNGTHYVAITPVT